MKKFLLLMKYGERLGNPRPFETAWEMHDTLADAKAAEIERYKEAEGHGISLLDAVILKVKIK